MRIALLALGTRGDVHPIVALGAELRRRGHSVVLGLSTNLVGTAHKLGLDAVPIGWDTQRLLESAEGQQWVRSGDAESFTGRMYEITDQYSEQLDTETIEVCEGADAIVANVLLENRAVALGEAWHVPVIIQDCFPRRANGVVPHPLITTEPLPTEGKNRATYRQFERLNWQHMRGPAERFRTRLGLPLGPPRPVPPTSPRRPLELQTYSGAMFPGLSFDEFRPMVGDLRFSREDLAASGTDSMDPDLMAWLDAGTPPAFLTFGSTFAEDQPAMLASIGRVCRELGVRAIVATGWGLSGPTSSPDPDVRLVSYVEYDVVLPRCALVVHHGSASITASGVRAGIPTMVCSSFFDQPFWGEQVARLGIGTHVRFHQLDEDVLRDGMRRLLTDPVRERAAALGRAVRAERDGTPAAADELESYVARYAAEVDGR
ncbi:MAG: glycosyltransferase [Actinocatenispora sp.]